MISGREIGVQVDQLFDIRVIVNPTGRSDDIGNRAKNWKMQPLFLAVSFFDQTNGLSAL
jgi:hypothetical protein